MRRHYLHNGRITLHIFKRGNVTLQRYCRKIVLNHVLLFRATVHPDFLFMDDNAGLNRNTEVSPILKSDYINGIQWLACSLDQNPFDDAWVHVSQTSPSCARAEICLTR